MRFVVPISLSTYLFFLLIAFALAIKVFAIVAVVGFIYFLFRYPKETFGLVIMLLSLHYWQISLPIFAIYGITKYCRDNKKPDTPPSPTLLLEHIPKEDK